MSSFVFGDVVKKSQTTRPLVVLASRVRDGVEEIKVIAEADSHPWWCKASSLVPRSPAEAGNAVHEHRYHRLLLLCARLALAQGIPVRLQDGVLQTELSEGNEDWPVEASRQADFQTLTPYPASSQQASEPPSEPVLEPASELTPEPAPAPEPTSEPATDPGLSAQVLAYVENRFGEDIRIAVEQLATEGVVTATILQATRIKNFLEIHDIAFRYQPTGQHSARLTTTLPLSLEPPEDESESRQQQIQSGGVGRPFWPAL